MGTEKKNYALLFSILDETLQNFVTEVSKHKLTQVVTNEWSVKDELCHIVFWHRYYAQNYSALADGKEPFIFTSKGGSTRNIEGVNSLKNKSKDELLKLLDVAQRELYKSIVVQQVPEMNYTNRKKYTTEDFLNEIIRHIKGHTTQIIKAKQH